MMRKFKYSLMSLPMTLIYFILESSRCNDVKYSLMTLLMNINVMTLNIFQRIYIIII